MSTRRVCDYCGLPATVRGMARPGPFYCCTGCAMVARIPVDAQGQFPVNSALIQVLSSGFLLFNQALFAGLAAVLGHQGKQVNGHRFEWASYGVGLVLALLFLVLARRSRATTWADHVVFALVLGVYLLAWRVVPPSAACVLGANGLLLAWVTRGVWRRRLRKF